MKKIGMQLVRVKPLQVSIDYTIRLINAPRIEDPQAARSRLIVRPPIERQPQGRSGDVDLREPVAAFDDKERVIQRTGRREPIPRLEATSPRVRAAVPSNPSGAPGPSEPVRRPESERQIEPLGVPTGAVQPKATLPSAPTLPLGPEAEVSAPQSQRKSRSSTPKAKPEQALQPTPMKGLKVIRRRGEQAPKVFETATREFLSAMLRGVKVMQDKESDTR